MRNKRPKMSRTIMVLTAVMVAVCVLSTGTLSFYNYQKQLIRQVATSRVDILVQISSKIEEIQNHMLEIADSYHTVLQEAEQQGWNTSQLEEGLAEKDELWKQVMLSNHIEYFSTVLSGCEIIYESHGDSQPLDYDQLANSLWYLRIPIELSENEPYWVYSHKFPEKGDQFYFTLAQRRCTERGIDTILVNVPERILYNTFENILGNNDIYVVSQGGRIIAQNEPGMCGLNYFNMATLNSIVTTGDYKVIEKSGVRYLISRYDSPDYGLTYIEEIPLSELTQGLSELEGLIFLIAALVMVGSELILVTVIHRVFAPVTELCNRLERVSNGEFDTTFDVGGYQEIQVIADAAGDMTRKISTLFEDAREQERLKHLAELEFLQAQINPHFMYNTLFSIKCLVSLEENEAAENMIDSFTSMLRTTLESKETIITLRMELTSLRHYFEVLRYRYGDEIVMHYDVPEVLMEYRILKFILQPIAENCVFHALEPGSGGGNISISARVSGQQLQIRVVDDGVGMDEEKLSEVRQQILTGGEHVGFYNIQKRIQLHFGKEYGIQINSKPNQGTEVCLVLPVLRGEDAI